MEVTMKPMPHAVDDALQTHELELLVKQVSWEADNVIAIVLVDRSGGELPGWAPGAHLELALPNGVIRHYSLCGDPADRHTFTVAVLNEVSGRGGSRFLHEELRVGSLLVVRAVRNNFAFVPTERMEFIAGGIGITPLLPMIRAAEAAGVDWRLWYGGRSRSGMAFLSDLERFDDHRVRLYPQDELGFIDIAAALANPSEDASVYCCGPEPLLDAVGRACESWPDGALRIERFAASDEMKALLAEPGGPFEVTIASSGTTVVVEPGESIMDALEHASLSLPFSCREGICGSCETGVLEGVAEHRDAVLTDAEREEGKTMMICVSRAKTARLVLDL